MSKLTETQTIILNAAAIRNDGNIEPLPKNINAGIKSRVIKGLVNRELITQQGDIYCINDTGFEAIGAAPPAPENKPKVTKQAKMITLMQRPQGASIEELCAETGWQKHTVRGVFANVLKKRLGLTVTSTKGEDEPRRYLIQS